MRSQVHADRFEYLGDFSQCACASLLGLADDRKHVGRVPIRFCLHDIHGALAGHSEPGITKGHPARLRSRKGLTSTRGDECALLLSQRGEQVPHERSTSGSSRAG